MKNKVFLIGNVGKDPEITIIEGYNIPVAKFSLATSEKWKNKQTNEMQERTEWHNIVFKGEIVNSLIKEYIKKGSQLCIEGSIRTRSWETSNGEKRYMTEINGYDIQLLNSVRNRDNDLADKNTEDSETDEIPF